MYGIYPQSASLLKRKIVTLMCPKLGVENKFKKVKDKNTYIWNKSQSIDS